MPVLVTDPYPWAGALLHTWVELLTLLVLLVVALALMGWAWNRGFRPADRGPLLSWQVLALGYALLLLLHHVRMELLSAAIIAIGLLAGGFVSRTVRPYALWMPSVAVAVLIGLGLNLSAATLTLVVTLLLLFSPYRAR